MLRRQFIVGFGLVTAGCGGWQLSENAQPSSARRANTNMTAEDREAARANMERVHTKVYKPTLDALRTDLLQSFENPNRAAAEALAARAEEKGRIAHFNVLLGILGWKRQFGDAEAVEIARYQRELDILAEHDTITALAVAHAAALGAGKPAAAKAIASRGKGVFPLPARATEQDVKATLAGLPESLASVRDRFLEALRSKLDDEGYAKLAPKFEKDFEQYIRMAKENKEVVLASKRQPTTAGGGAADPATGQATPGDTKAALSAYVGATLDSASTLFPLVGVVVRGVEAARALAKGDTATAIDAALAMVPASGLAKDALAAGAGLLKQQLK